MPSSASPIDEGRRREFEREWIEHGSARIDNHLPDVSDPAYPATLLELVCIDMEMQARRGDVPSVSGYVRRYALDDESRARLREEAAYLARSHVSRGSRIGRYVLREILGQGAFATVWRAHDTDLSRVVALKRLRAALGTDEEARERFRREALSAARLRHPAIVTVHQVGEDASGPYLVSDFIPGPTLREALTKRSFPPDEAARLVARLADALHYAHQFGIVHRDVKPGNVLLDESGRPLLTDFGLARLGESDATLTRHGQLLGTPAYMSPEQVRGDVAAIDARSDVYGLGVVLYELLCGRPPFQGESATLFYAIVHKDVPRPRKLKPEVPTDLERICLKALAREPDRRYGSAGEFADDLRRYLERKPVEARRSGVLGRTVLWTRRNPAVALSLAAIVVVVAIAFLRVLEERERFEQAHRLSQANLYSSLVRQAEAQLALPRGAGREAAWASLEEAAGLATEARDPVELRSLGLRYLTARGPHFRERASWNAPEDVTALALSPDGDRVVEIGAGGVRLRDAATGEVLAADAPAARAVAFSPAGTSVAVASGRIVRVLDAATLSERVSFESTAPASTLAFDPYAPGRIASASPTGPVEVFVLEEGRPRRTHALPYPAHSVAFGVVGHLVVGCADGTIHLVDLATGESVWTTRFAEPVREVAAYGDRVAAFSYERLRFTILDHISGGRREPEGLHEAALRHVHFGPDGYVLAVSSDGLLAAYDKELARVAQSRLAVGIRTAAAAGGTVLAVDREGRRRVWEMQLPRGRRTLFTHHRASFVPGTSVLFGGSWSLDCADGTWKSAPPQSEDVVTIWGVAVDGTGRHVARTTHAGVIELLDAATLRRERVLQESGELAWTAAFGDKGRVLAAGSGNDVLVFDVEEGTLLQRLEGHEHLVLALVFDGERLVSSSRDRTVRVWDWRRGTQTRRLAEGITVNDLLALEGRVIAACDDGRLRVWMGDQTEPTVVPAGSDPLWALGAGPDGMVATGSQSGRVRLWEGSTWRPIAELRAGPRIRSVDFDDTGRYLAASVYVADGVVWDIAWLRGELGRLGLDWD